MPYILSRSDAVRVVEAIRLRIRDYFRAHQLTYAVFGKSEGLDSSVIAGLLSDIEGVQPVGVIIPIETAPGIVPLARAVLDHFSIPTVEVDLAGQYRSLRDQFYSPSGLVDQVRGVVRPLDDQTTLDRIDEVQKLACGNIKVRLRMITLYHVAQLLKGLVVSTDNYSEYWMGFWTLNGDVGDISPIQSVFKGSELYTIGQVLGIPEKALNAVPSDGLGITKNGFDEDQLGFPYDQLDRVILRLLKSSNQPPVASRPGRASPEAGSQQKLISQIAEELGFAREKVESVSQRLTATEFKRHWPVIFTREEIGLPALMEIEDLNC